MTVADCRLPVAGGACREVAADQRFVDPVPAIRSRHAFSATGHRPPSTVLRDPRPRPPATGYRPLFIAFALLSMALAANATTIPLPRYIASLQELRNTPKSERPALARQLIGTEVNSPNGRFLADASLLAAVSGKSLDADARLDAEIAALRHLAPVPRAAVADPRVIETLRRDEAASALRRGGDVGSVPSGNEDAITRWMEGIGKGFEWIWKQIEALADWFSRWWPSAPETKVREVRRSPGVPFLVTALVIAIVCVLTVLALEVIRRSRPGQPEAVVTSTPRMSKGDEDPLSRGATEWERYAAQLVAAGRMREAIRAWYHAVLVTLYAGGILRFRKGRTNWEYIAALSPELTWRSAFVQLTGRFEQEWYGRDESTIEALDECSGRARMILTSVRRAEAA